MNNLIHLIIPIAHAMVDPGPGGDSPAGTTVDIGTPATAGNFFGYSCLGNLISNFVSAAFIIAGVAFFIFFVIGGLEWILSGGDKVKVDQAQKRLTNALIGLVIVAISYAVYTLVINFFGIDMSSLCPTS